MPPLLSFAFGAVLSVLTALVVIALSALTILLILLVLLAADLLLERNGVDRRAGAQRLVRRLREPAQQRPSGGEQPPAPASQESAAEPIAPRVPFSARRPARTPRQTAPAQAVVVVPEEAPVVVEPVEPVEPLESVPEPVPAPVPVPVPAAAPAVPRWAAEPVPPLPVVETPPDQVPDAVTEVIAVEQPPAPRTAPRARAARTPRPTARRTPTPEPAPAPTAPLDRDSAIDRLFAPLLESDRTEPLPKPRTVRRPAQDD